MNKSAESAAKVALYGFHFAWGLRVFYGTEWMPGYLLGTGSFENAVKDMPFTPCPAEVHLFALSFLGKFCSGCVDLFSQTDRPDFNEMLAHHIATVSLTFGMIVANNRVMGTILAWQQCAADVFVSLARILSSMPFTAPTLGAYFCMLPIWIWTRVHNFARFQWFVLTRMFYPAGREQFNMHTRIYAFYGIVLFVMQLYWTVLLIQMMLSYLKYGSLTDLQRQVKKSQ